MNDNAAICWSSQFGTCASVALLLADERVDPAARYNHAIDRASSCGHKEVVNLLWEDRRVQTMAAVFRKSVVDGVYGPLP